MSRRAVEVGVHVERGRVADVRQLVGHVEVDGRRARYLVAADGLHSPVRAALGLETPPRRRGRARPARYGVRRHLRTTPWSDLVEVHWADDCEVYVTPVADDLVGVALLGHRGARLDDVLARLPRLAARLDGAEPVGSDRGAGPLRQDVRRREAGRVLLVGDAGGYVDALTGEGIRLAALEARAAVRCLRAGRPEDYEREWRAITGRYRHGTRTLLALSERALTRGRIVPAAARFPAIFARCVDALGADPNGNADGTARSDGTLTPPTATP
jgi:flavin-dependent dehydrogenase